MPRISDWVKQAGEFSRNSAAIVIAVVATAGLLWSLFGDDVKRGARKLTADPSASACVVIPATGHHIDSAKRGEWATVTWSDIRRISDCSRPSLTAVLSNGDGAYHDVDLSTTGINLDKGVNAQVKYKFRIPEGVTAGSAWFRITLDFHEDGRSINSPKIYFTIMDD